MKEKLLAYLRDNKDGVAADTLVKEVLGIEGASAEVAEKVVSTAVKDDPRFVRTPRGAWKLGDGEDVRSHSLDDARFLLFDIEQETPWGPLIRRMHFRTIEGGQIRSGGQLIVDTSATDISARAKWLQTDDASESSSVGALFDVIDSACVVAFRVELVRRILNRLSLSLRGDDLECECVSLRRLARRLTKRSVAGTADLAGVLGLTFVETEKPDEEIGFITELFLAVIDKCKEKGIRTLERLIEFQERIGKPINFARYRFDEQFLRSLPESPGVYLMKSRLGELLYVGKARSLKKRIRSYFQTSDKDDPKISLLRDHLFDIEVRTVGSELEALLLEYELIKEHDPPVNRQVQIHRRQVGSQIRADRILVLPSAEPNAVEVFFATQAGWLVQRRFSMQDNVGSDVRDLIKDMYFTDSQDQPESDDSERTEIVFSWLDRHQDDVSWIDVSVVADVDDCCRLLATHVSKFDQSAKQIFV